MTPILCRLIKSTYTYTGQENTGETVDVYKNGSHQVLWTLGVDDPQTVTAEQLGMSITHFPKKDYEGDPQVGDSDFVYFLEAKQPDGSWSTVNILDPYPTNKWPIQSHIRCSHCGRRSPTHPPDCPAFTPEGSDERRWCKNGYEAGRSGKKAPPGASKAYMMGWIRGEAAAEEAYNGSQSWSD